jgi:uncharacterized membrane protein YhaH (DUF805 family)
LAVFRWSNGTGWYRDVFLSTAGRISRETWWLGTAAIMALIVIINVVATLIAFQIFPRFSVLDGHSLVARSRFAGWLMLSVFAVIAWPLYALCIKRRHDRGSRGYDVMLCLVLNALLLAGQAAGIQWLLNYNGFGYAWLEVPSIPNLVMPLPTEPTRIVLSIISVFTFAMVIPLGFLRSRDDVRVPGTSAEDILPWGAPAAEPRKGWPRLQRATLVPVIAAFVVGAAVFAGASYFLARQVPETIVIGKPLGPGLEAVMSTVPSGQTREVGGMTVTPIATYANGRAEHCRSLSADDGTPTIAVVCRLHETAGNWTVTFAASERPDVAVPSATLLPQLNDYLKSVRATIPFTLEGEALVVGFCAYDPRRKVFATPIEGIE